MGPESMTDMRPSLINFSMSTPGSFVSAVSSNGCLAKIVAPIMEVNALISSSSRSWNDALTTVEYKEYNSSNLPALRSCSLV